MKKIIGALLLGSALCLAFSATALPAWAATTSHHKHHTKKPAKAMPDERVRDAQTWLIKLSYDPGPVDGFMGPKTEAALAAFERDHDMIPIKILTDKIYDMLRQEVEATKAAEAAATPHPDFFALHPDFYGYYGPEYTNPTMLNMPQAIPTRYGDMELTEDQPALTREYTVMLNGQPVFHADHQPSAMELSRTFIIGDADAVVLTAYDNGNSVCPYQHYLLVVRASSTDVLEVYDCSRIFKAYTAPGGLFISFAGNHVDGWSSGAMWRYNNGMLVRL